MITKGYKANFETLQNACRSGDLALLDCTDKKTGKPVMVICAVGFDREKDEYIMTPIAKMFDGNPYEEINPPE